MPVHAADDAALRRILAPWRLPTPLQITSPSRGTNNLTRLVTTASERYVLRVYPSDRDLGRLTAEHSILTAMTSVAGAGVPFAVPRPVPTPAGETLVPAGEHGTACLFAYIPGQRPDPQRETALRDVGAAYATLDVALADLSRTPALAALPDWRPGLAALHPLAADPAAWVAALPAEALSGDLKGWLPRWLAAVDERGSQHRGNLPVQVVHGDPGLSNVLYAGGRVTGVIDFEFAGLDVRLADLADALHMLVADWSDPAERARAGYLCAGYGGVLRLAAAEIAAVPDRLRLRAAGSLVWRMGRFSSGHATAADVADRARDAYRLEQWLAGNSRQIVDLVMRHVAA